MRIIRTDDSMKRVPVLYLDLDGTVRHGKDELGHFVNTLADVHVFPEVPPMLRRYKNAGWRIVACSNQGGIAMGHLSMDDCIKMMVETSRQCDDLFDKISWCQHHPQAKDPELAVCWCRKPLAGLVIDSARAMNEKYPREMYPPHLALFVGDRQEDEGCAANANIRFMNAKDWRAGAHTL